MSPNIFISAGEASGEHYGALLIDALKRRLASAGSQATYFGMGGERMVAAGLDRVVRSEDMAVMGITEVVRHLPRIYREFRKLKRAICTRRPDVAILIDFPDIHFKLAKELHRLGVPVLFFVSPQLWAWKKRRIELVRKYVTHMLVIFPFEEKFYRDRGIHAQFVGHPLADLPLPTISREDFAAAHGLDPSKLWIGLLPGSRAKEIADNLPEMLAATNLLAQRQAEFLLPIAPTLTAAQRTSVSALVNHLRGHLSVHLIDDTGSCERPASGSLPAEDQGAPPMRLSLAHGWESNQVDASEQRASAPPQVASEQRASAPPQVASEQRASAPPQVASEQRASAPPQVVSVRSTAGGAGGGARAALFHARASIVASGTATVEAALIGNPFVVVYRVSALTYAIAKRVVTVPHIAMANLIAGKRVVPELIQNDFTAAKIVAELAPLLPDGPPRESMMQELRAIGGLLRSAGVPKLDNSLGAIDQVAAVALDVLAAAHSTTSPPAVQS